MYDKRVPPGQGGTLLYQDMSFDLFEGYIIFLNHPFVNFKHGDSYMFDPKAFRTGTRPFWFENWQFGGYPNTRTANWKLAPIKGVQVDNRPVYFFGNRNGADSGCASIMDYGTYLDIVVYTDVDPKTVVKQIRNGQNTQDALHITLPYSKIMVPFGVQLLTIIDQQENWSRE